MLAGAQFTPGLWAVLGAFFLWGMASQAFGAVQDIIPDREGGLSSIATVLGGKAVVRLAFGAYAAAGALMLFTAVARAARVRCWPLPYLLNLLPFLGITDERSEEANAGWKRFLKLNFLTGFLVTMLLIWYWPSR